MRNLESQFRSYSHKYNYVIKIFFYQKVNRNRGESGLYYQPYILKVICEKYPLNKIVKAINKTLDERRDNYFRYFVELLGVYKPDKWVFRSLNGDMDV